MGPPLKIGNKNKLFKPVNQAPPAHLEGREKYWWHRFLTCATRTGKIPVPPKNFSKQKTITVIK
jgi:hypothetical protein